MRREDSIGRGEGFELRTDRWGAVRAGAGLLLSTHPQAQAQAYHLDASPAKRQLESSLAASKGLSELAQNQQTDPLETLEHLKEFLNQIELEDQTKAASFKQAVMILCAPNSIAVSTQQDLHLSADQHIHQSAAGSINVSTQKSVITHARDKISLFAAEQGIRAFAAKGKVEIQAQDGAIDAIARQKIKLISTEDRVEITSPKEIVLTAGGSQIKINSKGVFVSTSAKFEAKAGQHCFEGGEKIIEEKIKSGIITDFSVEDASAIYKETLKNGEEAITTAGDTLGKQLVELQKLYDSGLLNANDFEKATKNANAIYEKTVENINNSVTETYSEISNLLGENIKYIDKNQFHFFLILF